MLALSLYIYTELKEEARPIISICQLWPPLGQQHGCCACLSKFPVDQEGVERMWGSIVRLEGSSTGGQ